MKSNVYEVIYTAEAQSVFIDSEKKRTFESSTSNCVEIVEGLFFLLRRWKKKEYCRRDKVKNRREMQVEWTGYHKTRTPSSREILNSATSKERPRAE